MRKLLPIIITLCAFAFSENAKGDDHSFSFNFSYYNEVSVGYGTTTKVNGYDLHSGRFYVGTVQGVKFNDYFMTGLGLDIVPFTHYYPGQGMRWGMTFYGDFRGMYPLKHSFTPFIDFGCGAMFSLRKAGTGFYCLFGPGIMYKHWAFSCGLNAIGTGDGSCSFFLKFAYSF